MTEKKSCASVAPWSELRLGRTPWSSASWIAKLQGEGVAFLTAPYRLGDTRAVMIEGPSREAIELVEVR